MPRIGFGETVDHGLLTGRLAGVSIQAVIAAQQAVRAKAGEELCRLRLARIEARRRALDVPRLVRMRAQQQQRLELADRVDVSEDEVPQVAGDDLIRHSS